MVSLGGQQSRAVSNTGGNDRVASIDSGRDLNEGSEAELISNRTTSKLYLDNLLSRSNYLKDKNYKHKNDE